MQILSGVHDPVGYSGTSVLGIASGFMEERRPEMGSRPCKRLWRIWEVHTVMQRATPTVGLFFLEAMCRELLGSRIGVCVPTVETQSHL